ncbi:phosphoribosyl-ATP diphosphatase [Caldivirga sp. UBA161]|uniref:phosphoribosyl-ATP diphosphatase n=1 Tax=Caldivirga sp. UBA161 TaxID=1915569 RepID=UPI0025C1D328|nr:phosphoribosyl-ATP diphosphatase [Caldivirga sp. UBA161]
MDDCDFLKVLEGVIDDRIRTRRQGSYTYSLYVGGVSLISKKVGEEAVEVAVAAMAKDKDWVIRESADLMYHLLVLLRVMGLNLSDVCRELRRRHEGEGGG